MKLFAISKISCSRSVLLASPNWRMGTLAASYFRMFAGNMPGGIWRSDVFIVAVTCATAISTLTFGWK